MKIAARLFVFVLITAQATGLFAADSQSDKAQLLEREVKTAVLRQSPPLISDEAQEQVKTILLQKHPDASLHNLGIIYQQRIHSEELADEVYVGYYIRVSENLPEGNYLHSYYLVKFYGRTTWDYLDYSSMTLLTKSVAGAIADYDEREHRASLQYTLTQEELPANILAAAVEMQPLSNIKAIVLSKQAKRILKKKKIGSFSLTLDLLNADEQITRKFNFYPVGSPFDDTHTYGEVEIH